MTTVRDAADVDGTSSQTVRTAVPEGRFPGPRSFACGPLVEGAGGLWPNTVHVLDAASAEAAVAEIAGDGWDCVKVYNTLPAEALVGVHAAADRLGLPVIGHVPTATSFEEARLDDTQHLVGVARAKGDTRDFPAILSGWRSFGPADSARVIEASLRLGLAHTPTFVTLERGFAYRDYAALRESADVKLLPPYYRDIIWSPTEGIPFLRGQGEAEFQLKEDAYLVATQLVGEMHRAGVTIHAGTDTQIPYIVPGAAL
ncbi:MAG: hypothetical protein JRH10_23105, partial [Deltaproteobacteria bacterium]|nr:hypothetical protein [Deltaproteobacteria bacterium]